MGCVSPIHKNLLITMYLFITTMNVQKQRMSHILNQDLGMRLRVVCRLSLLRTKKSATAKISKAPRGGRRIKREFWYLVKLRYTIIF